MAMIPNGFDYMGKEFDIFRKKSIIHVIQYNNRLTHRDYDILFNNLNQVVSYISCWNKASRL